MNISKLKTSNIFKFYNQNNENICVLNNINYTFEQNKIYSIQGESGTGKSTLLNLLTGLDAPTTGHIYFNDSDINLFSQKQKDNFLTNDVGMIFQEPYLIKELTVLENIMLKALIKKNNIQQSKEKALNLLSKINLIDKANVYPTSLSVGQQQRIALLRAIFNEPKFLIADEPTSNLDHQTKSEIVDLLYFYKNEFNMGLIIATHDSFIINSSEKKIRLSSAFLKEII